MSPEKKRSFLLPSVGDALFMSLFLLIALHSGIELLNDGDTGYHIRAGEYMLRTLSIPHHDMFSHLSPPPVWTAHEWLSEVIMALVHGSFGLTGVVIFFAFFIALAAFLLFRFMRGHGNDILVCLFVAILAAAASQLHWLARPHVFSLVLMVVWYRILDLFQYEGKSFLYFLPVIMLLWVNLHGGFMAGFILLAAYILGNGIEALRNHGENRSESLKRLKALFAITLACVAATIVNPNGYHILLFPFQLTSSKVLMDGVSEFLSPNFHEYSVKLFETYLLILIAVVSFSKKRLNAIEIILLVLFVHMSLYSARYIPLFSIVAAPVLSERLDALLQASHSRFAGFLKKRSRNISLIDAGSTGYVWPLVSVVAALTLAVTGRVAYSFDPKIKPIAAIEFLKQEKIPGNMFNDDEFGDCMIYAASPMYKVFIDGRLDMYGAAHLIEYRKVTGFKQGWEKVIDKYNISWIIFDADAALSRHLLIDKDWKLIYADKVANIFVRNVPAYRGLIKKYDSVRPVVIEDKKD